jgi:CHASE2 domain-containing sensor protein
VGVRALLFVLFGVLLGSVALVLSPWPWTAFVPPSLVLTALGVFGLFREVDA